MKRLWVLGLVLLVPMAALAQGSSSNRTAPVSRDLWAASDGCENILGQAHNSADCSRIDQLNPRDVLPDKPLSQMTGAERNLLRNRRILSATATTLERVRLSAPPLSDEAVTGMIRSMSGPAVAGEGIARWTDGLCVRTQGLRPELNAAVDRRIRQLAAMIGAPIAEGNCAINAAVLFEADPVAVLKDMARQHPRLFAGSGNAATLRYPVQAWYAVPPSGDLRGNARPNAPIAPEECDTDQLSLNPSGLVQMSSPNLRNAFAKKSRCYNQVRKPGFGAVTVIASANLFQQHDPAAVADYVAVLILSRVPDSDACQPVPSIVHLLKQGCSAGLRSDEITGSDLAFLVALYRAGQRNAVLKVDSIASEMKQVLQGR
jgi:hypothetical protein